MAGKFFCVLLPLLIAVSQTFPTAGANPTTKFPAEKLSTFQFYWHDTSSGSNPTAVNVVPPPARYLATTGFGFINMFDDPMTEKPEAGSKFLGRSQGFYSMVAQGESALLMAINFVFSTGKYNGSTLTVLGWNPVLRKVREMPVTGGTGLFRFARGYVEASTYTFNATSGDAVIKFNAHILHY